VNILLVDDDAEVRAATKELLEDLGHHVVDVQDSRTALDLIGARGDSLDALVTDLRIPGMSGIELLESLLAQGSELALLAYSGTGGDERLEGMIRDGRVTFLRKPFSAQSLASKLGQAALPRRPVALPLPPTVPLSPAVKSAPQQPGRRRRFPFLPVAAMLVLVFGVVFSWSSRGPVAPLLPERLEEAVRRGARFEALEPLGELMELPEEFRWQKVPGAERYRLRIREVDGTSFWETLVPEERASIPADVLESMASAVVYHWWVEALNGASNPIAVSGQERFLVRPDPAGEPAEPFHNRSQSGGA